jgi:hypothetical protein
MIDRNVISQASTLPGILKSGNNVVAADVFTAVKRTKAKEETSSTPSQSLKKNKQPMIGVRNSSSLPIIVKG